MYSSNFYFIGFLLFRQIERITNLYFGIAIVFVIAKLLHFAGCTRHVVTLCGLLGFAATPV